MISFARGWCFLGQISTVIRELLLTACGTRTQRSIMVICSRFLGFIWLLFFQDSLMFELKRAVKVPSYCVFQSEADGDQGESERIWKTLSYYTRLRVIIDVVLFEYLSHVFIFRWIFNIFAMLFGLLDSVYPLLAVQRFGKKYAFVQIMKPKK